VLEAASVAGVEFSANAVAAGLGVVPVKAVEGCEALARRGQFPHTLGLVESPDGTVTARFRFVHALYQNVLYQRIAEGRQLRLHRSIGQHLEAAYRSRAKEIAAELARLHEQAFDFESVRKLCEQGFQKAREVQLGYGQLMSMVLLGFAHLGLDQSESAF
jgi:predicted ATPase